MKKTTEPEFFSKQVVQARRFYIEGNPSKDSPVKVVCGGCEHTTPDFIIDRKEFPYYSLEFISKGEGLALLNGKRFDLKPGVIFSYGPRISQFITVKPAHTMVKYFIDFTGSAAKQMLERYVSHVGTAVRTHRPDEITRLLDELIRHGLSDSPYRSLLCSTLFEYLLVRIAETTVTEETELGRGFLTYQVCRQHIKENFIRLNSLQDIADSCNIGSAYLCRLFKKFDTQSPYQCLIHLKMAYAAECLQEPGVLVKEIAFDLGFDDPFHFSRTFKKVFGISPQSFKRLR